MSIINLTQHTATAEQAAAGVINLSEFDRADLIAQLSFHELPTMMEVDARAEAIAALAVASGCEAAMVGGAPWLMAPLELALKEAGIRPLYAFSRRESVETVQPDGSVVKTGVFRHLGFLEVDL